MWHRRYDVREKLAEGAQTETLLAEDREANRQVVVKRLELEGLDDWKAFELFERRAETLDNLDHARLPEVFELVRPDRASGSGSFVLIQEFVPGETLQTWVDREGPLSEDDTRKLLEQMLELLEYLHAFNPAVVHRDVKPSNIIRHPSGDYHLVDFGGVQNVAQDTVGGETMFGTPGYAAPEQLMGRAGPESDIYGVGTTALFAATGRNPEACVDASGRLQLEAFPEVPAGLSDAIDEMVASDPGERIGDAVSAKRRLGNSDELPSTTGSTSNDQPPPVARQERSDLTIVPREDWECSLSTEGTKLELTTPVVRAGLGNLLFIVSGLTLFGAGAALLVILEEYLFAAVAMGALLLGVVAEASDKSWGRRFSPVRERLTRDPGEWRYRLEVEDDDESDWTAIEETAIPVAEAYPPYLECSDRDSGLTPREYVRDGGDQAGLVIESDADRIVFGGRFLSGNRLYESPLAGSTEQDRFEELAELTGRLRSDRLE